MSLSSSFQARYPDVTVTRIAAINNRYMDFILTRGLIPLVNDNHLNNYLTEILVSEYLGSIVDKRPKNDMGNKKDVVTNHIKTDLCSKTVVRGNQKH